MICFKYIILFNLSLKQCFFFQGIMLHNSKDLILIKYIIKYYCPHITIFCWQRLRRLKNPRSHSKLNCLDSTPDLGSQSILFQVKFPGKKILRWRFKGRKFIGIKPVREWRKLDWEELIFNEISKKATADPMGSSRTRRPMRVIVEAKKAKSFIFNWPVNGCELLPGRNCDLGQRGSSLPSCCESSIFPTARGISVLVFKEGDWEDHQNIHYIYALSMCTC